MKGDPSWDAVIVGAGAGGAATAYGLCTRGLSVLLLDAGPSFDPAVDYPLTTSDWDAREFPEKPGSTGSVTFTPGQKLEPAEPLLASGSRGLGPLVRTGSRWMEKYYHVRGIGGSTLHFTGEAHRLNPQSMKMKSRFGVAADWPFDYAELEPYYAQAEELIGVAGPPQQGARWRSREFPLPPHPLSYAAQTLGRSAAALGLEWQANSRAALSRPRNGRLSCNYCGACQKGCPRGDKGSVDVTFIPAAVATGRCVVRPNSPVVRIEAGAGDRVAAVLVGRPDGSLERITTPHLILACGAVETPRLLLASDGLANDGGEVGRNFMDTLEVVIGAFHPDPQLVVAVFLTMPSAGTSMLRTPSPGRLEAAEFTMPARKPSFVGLQLLPCAQCPVGVAIMPKQCANCGGTNWPLARSAKACPMTKAASTSTPIAVIAMACRCLVFRLIWNRAISPACASWRRNRANC